MHLFSSGLLMWMLITALLAAEAEDITITTEGLGATAKPTTTSAENPTAAENPTTTTAENPTTTTTENPTSGTPENIKDKESTTAMNENHASGPATSESNIQATEEQMLTCQSFHCIGKDCYKDETNYMNTSDTCLDGSFCEMYRHNSSHYEARCSQHCMNQNCMENGTAVDGCVMYCCNSSMCLTVDAVINAVPDDMNNNTTMKASTPMMTTAMPTTTATTISYSDKKCRSFKCAGLDCFKTQTGAPTKQCRVGINHCELQKVVASGGSVSYEGGCSNTCSTSKNSCASITNANCFQECCNATNTGCCMKLDGQVHFNTAAHISRGSVLKIVSCAIIVIFTSRFFSSFRA